MIGRIVICDCTGLEYFGLSKFSSPLLAKTLHVLMYIVDFREENVCTIFPILNHEIVFS